MNRPTAVADPPAQTPSVESSKRLGHIQGLRGVAVLVVVLYHAGVPLPGGFTGVDMFFVISGFVIARLLVRDLDRDRRIHFARFYVRRFKRLLPALGVVLVFVAVGSALLQSPTGSQQDTALTGIAGSMWLANGALYLATGDYFDNGAETMPLLHTWSLAVEEQFYLVFPLLIMVGAVVAYRSGRTARQGVLVITVVAVVASFCLSLWLSYFNPLPGVTKPASAAFYSMPTRAWEFGLGVLCALWVARGASRRTRQGVGSGMAAVSAVAVLVSLFIITDSAPFPGVLAMLPVLATAGLVLNGGGPHPVGRFLSSRPMQFLGDISYSWYLWHWPMIVFALIVFGPGWPMLYAAALSLGVAYASWRWVEEPIRRLPDRPYRKVVVPTLAFSAVPVLLFSTLFLGAEQGWGRGSIQKMQASVDPVPMGYSIGCHSMVPIGDRDMRPCTFEGGGSQKDIWLVGDSNAGMYAEALTGAGKRLDRTVHLASASGCPLVDVTVHEPGKNPRPCRNFVKQSMEDLSALPPSTIVLAAANENVTNDGVALSRGRGKATNEERAKQRMWQQGLNSVVKNLKNAGHSVVVVETAPHLPSSRGEGWFTTTECTTIGLLRDAKTCNSTVSLNSENRRQASALQAERSGTLRGGGTLMPVRDTLCPDGQCAAQHEERWVFRDGLHISVPQSRALTAHFADQLEHL